MINNLRTQVGQQVLLAGVSEYRQHPSKFLQMRKTYIHGLSFQQDRLDSKRGEIWDNVVKLDPNLRWVRDVCDHKSCEAGQHFDCLGYIEACRWLEVEQDR